VGVVLLLIEKGLGELEHVESEVVVGELAYPLDCILSDTLIRELGV
jgi:hypothetical protein